MRRLWYDEFRYSPDAVGVFISNSKLQAMSNSENSDGNDSEDETPDRVVVQALGAILILTIILMFIRPLPGTYAGINVNIFAAVALVIVGIVLLITESSEG